MLLEIITPDKELFAGEVKSVKVPGSAGSFEVLNNHAPILSTLEQGTIRVITEKEGTLEFDVKQGVIEVNNNKVIILA